MPRSALVFVVPEAEPVVAPLRRQHDRMSALGVPAHVTVLHPFRFALSEEASATIARVCAAAAPFDACFAETRRFPGDVVWLHPEPTEPFRAMMRAIAREFPDCPPYGGAFAEPVPHLTVGQGCSLPELAEIEEALAPLLPVVARVTHLTRLIEDEDSRWSVDRAWPLGTPTATR